MSRTSDFSRLATAKVGEVIILATRCGIAKSELREIQRKTAASILAIGFHDLLGRGLSAEEIFATFFDDIRAEYKWLLENGGYDAIQASAKESADEPS